jgi:hypothetical protein
MVDVLEPPVAETPSEPTKRGGGPRTPAGRTRARENAVKSSLRSKVLFSEDMACRILDRNAILAEQFKPRTRYQLMLVADMALAKARADHAAELLVENENRCIDCTVEFWDHDQKERALRLRKRLAKNPGLIAHQLSGFKQGAELLISAWEELAAVISAGGEWDADQRRLALDLKGVMPELRPGNPLLVETGPSQVSREQMAATAAREIARLRNAIESWLDAKDLDSQDDALTGLAFEEAVVTKRLRRYEAMARRDFEKAEAELLHAKAEGEREAVAKDKDHPTGPRPWDADSLIERIKAIKDPPEPCAEFQESPGPDCRPDETSPDAKTPASAPEVVVPASPTVGPATTTPAPASRENVSVETAVTSGEKAIEIPTDVDPAGPDALPWSITPPLETMETIVAKAQRSRRARKLLQRRRHEAERKAVANGR